MSKDINKKVDKTLQLGGTFYLYSQIVSSILVVLVCIAVIIYFAVYYRAGFETKVGSIQTVECKEGSEQSCTGGQYKTCTTTDVENCILTVTDPFRTPPAVLPSMAKTFKIKPTAGMQVDVYMNPSVPDSATLEPPLPVSIIIVAAVVVALSTAVWGSLAFAFRNNTNARRLGGVIEAVELLKR
jgi:hypothetical protein